VEINPAVTDTLGRSTGGLEIRFAAFAYAALLLNEINSNINSGKDLVELKVTTSGSLLGLKFQQQYATPADLFTFPDAQVGEGDLIVLHFNDSSVTTETRVQGQCTAPACLAKAWDFAVSGTTGLAFSHRVLVVRAPNGGVQDAVAFAVPNLADPQPEAFPGDVQKLQVEGLWNPTGCGTTPAALCTYASTPKVTDPTISVDWSSCENTPGGKSAQRRPGMNTRYAADWTMAASTWGTSNAGP
jgi:hypothetical protein